MKTSESINQERLVQTFLELVQIDSPSGHEKAIGERLKNLFSQLGCQVTMDAIGNLVARYEGEGEPVILSTHMDTVGADTGIKPVIREGVIYSDGTTILGADDKAGIALQIETLHHLNEHPELRHRPIEVVVTISEEIGCRGSAQLDMSQLQSKYGFVLDTGGPIGTFTYTAPWSRYFTVTIHGKRAHAGVAPEKGISAIGVAADAIANMPLGRIDEETVANIGTIHGGMARNIVADLAVIEAMTRSRNHDKLEAQTEKMVSIWNETAQSWGATVEIEIEDVYQGYVMSPDSLPYRELVRASEALGMKPNPKPSGGGTDANHFNRSGIQAVPVSIGQQNEHMKEECIAVQDMVDAARLMLALVTY
jgi:tripeptide aminopeptidase